MHVPASLAMQTYPDDQIELSDRISSRLEMGIAAIPKPFTLLTAFDSAKGVWVHVGTTPGNAHDIRVFKTGAYFQGLSANPQGALVIGTHPAELRQRWRPTPLRSVPHGCGLGQRQGDA